MGPYRPSRSRRFRGSRTMMMKIYYRYQHYVGYIALIDCLHFVEVEQQ